MGNSLNPLNESNTIRIGNTQTTCFIKGITGNTVVGSAVSISGSGQLGVVLSSRQYKHNIKPIENITKSIYKLIPVSFIYNSDETETERYGLIAEEVEQVLPALVIKNQKGQPYTICYDMLSVLLLKEIQKQQDVIKNLEDQIGIMKNELNNNNTMINTLMQLVTMLQDKIEKMNE